VLVILLPRAAWVSRTVRQAGGTYDNVIKPGSSR